MTYSKCGPAPHSPLLLLARRCGGASSGVGFAKALRRAVVMLSPPGAVKSPRSGARRCRAALPAPLRRAPAKSRRGEGVRDVVGDPSAGSTQRRVGSGARRATRAGLKTARRAEGQSGGGNKAHGPLSPRARTGVSPALPWNALGCVGAGGPAVSAPPPVGGSSSTCRPSLQTHFGWRPAINSELARTRGIRLSN